MTGQDHHYINNKYLITNFLKMRVKRRCKIDNFLKYSRKSPVYKSKYIMPTLGRNS